jgi:hypothetical protein
MMTGAFDRSIEHPPAFTIRRYRLVSNYFSSVYGGPRGTASGLLWRAGFWPKS